MTGSALAWFWTRVAAAASVPDRSLHLYRWVLGCYLLLFDAPFFAWIDRTPDAFFNPPVFSLAYLVGAVPPAPFFALLDIVAIVAICTMTVGYRTQGSTIIVLATRLIGTTFAYSTGKISHQILLSAVLLCMIIANWGEGGQDETAPTGSVRGMPSGTTRRSAMGLSLLAIMIAFGFFTAGLEKLLNWVNLNTAESGFLEWYYPRSYDYELHLLSDWVPGLPAELLKLGDISASVFEVSGLVALLCGAIVWRAWLATAVAFHIMNALLLNITFATQAVVYLAFVSLVFLDHPRVARFRRAGTFLVVLAGLWHVWTRVDGGGSGFFLWDGSRSTHLYDIYVCLAVCAMALGLLIHDLRSRIVDEQTPDPSHQMVG